MTEFSAGITNGSGPWGITAGPDGNVWFTESDGNRVGRIAPNGSVTEFTGISPNSEPRGITAGPDGNLWFTERAGNRIGQITTSGAVTEFSGGVSPGSSPLGIVAGPDGNLWFTETDGNRIARITPSGIVTEFSSGLSPGAAPFWITAGPDGNLWFTERVGNRIGRITPTGVITEFSRGVGPTAAPSGITAGPDGNVWYVKQGGAVGRVTLEPPQVQTGDVLAVTGSGATLQGTVDANNEPSTYTFEYGTSTAYGNSTAVTDAGREEVPTAVSAAISSLQPNTTYHYRIVVRYPVGVVAGSDRTFTTLADADGDGFQVPQDCDDSRVAVHPGAPDVPGNGIDEDCSGADAPVLDRDRDGFNRPQDCDDTNPTVYPGAAETLGNAVDEDCNGAPAPFRSLPVRVRLDYESRVRYTRVTALLIRALEGGEVVRVTCRGRGCPLRSWRMNVQPGRKKINLSRAFRRARLRPRTVIQLQISRPDAITRIVRFTFRRRSAPRRRELCVPPTGGAPRPC